MDRTARINTETIPDRHVSVAVAAEMLALSEYTVRKLLRRGVLRGSKVGGSRWAVPVKGIRAYLDSSSNEMPMKAGRAA